MAGSRVGRTLTHCVVAGILLALGLATGGCRSAECALERLPNRGRAVEPSDLAAIVTHAAKHECYDTLYDLLSDRTRAKYSRTELRWGFPWMRLPDDLGGGYVIDALKHGKYEADFPNKANPNERFAIYRYPPDTPKERLIRVLLTQEHPEGRCRLVTPLEWRIGLLDQAERGIDWAADRPK